MTEETVIIKFIAAINRIGKLLPARRKKNSITRKLFFKLF